MCTHTRAHTHTHTHTGQGQKTITALAAHPNKPYFVSTATDGWLRVWPFADSHYVHSKGFGNRRSDVNYWSL